MLGGADDETWKRNEQTVPVGHVVCYNVRTGSFKRALLFYIIGLGGGASSYFAALQPLETVLTTH